MVDWSGGKDRGAAPKADAIWIAVVRGGQADAPVYCRNRQVAEDLLAALIEEERAAGRRLLIGVDFPFGYPAGFAAALTGSDDPLGVWDWLEARIEDAPEANNRFDVAAGINRALGGEGPFWGNGLQRDIDGLSRTKPETAAFPEKRECESRAKGAFSCWQLSGAGSVGSQVLMGLPVLTRLRRRFDAAVWPFEPLDKPVGLVEIWPSLIARTIEALREESEIKDRAQVRIMARALANLSPDRLGAMLDVDAPEEGWILGLGHEEELARAADPLQPPPLSNDCFALPPGVDWTPVEDALAHLRNNLGPVVGVERRGLSEALGRVLAEDIAARRANPPQPNTAVDGYGFAGGLQDTASVTLPLVEGRAAAGVPFKGQVPAGHAIRVLTGAALPDGVDTVVLEEDVTTDGARIALRGPLKQGANTREAGEDVKAGEALFDAGRRVTPADLALLSATGHDAVAVRKPLRLGVLSTGDELLEPGQTAGPGQIYDANRPMLLGLAARWGYQPVDLGIAPDDREALRARLDASAEQADVILTSGGASAGDEDHMSALLREAGAMQMWRIAVKPGRPLALGLWRGVPVFGLPGNPVAAMVCALVFALPALGVLAGEGWQEPQGFDLPAAFEKRKKPGRREYLRARMRDGRADVFKSEGSGRISGLSWAEGLVELGDGARHIRPGDPVRFIPFGSFRL
ncbi:molybdopterin-binding protein [Primorskyibacter aestuariivivens]|nr:gephyrin-like molybdotransferase Glp [Primorskyibacter aestuariivivens]MDA7428254.1 molybdopterin-binding protein [Primorskyibacter aestuariivivens]